MKGTAVAGCGFGSCAALEALRVQWSLKVAAQQAPRGTTAEATVLSFVRDDAHGLMPLPRCGPFATMRAGIRRVGSNRAVAFDSDSYSLRWRLVGKRVTDQRRASPVRQWYRSRSDRS